MTQAPVAVASAVILPDAEEELEPVSANPLKRRQSSISSSETKRPRLSQDENTDTGPAAKDGSPPQRSDRLSERRKTGQLEERKRGQRLFGALLGTLSQSSSSTAQKRRADIEKKQQDKLRLQAEEEDEKKKEQLEILTRERQREQKIYDRQSMRIRHSNMLAQAHFLHTKAEPRLYYKPWQLLPGGDDRIRRQIQETKETIAQENGGQDPDIRREPLQQSNDADPAEMKIDKDDREEEDGKKDSETDPGEPRAYGNPTNEDAVLPDAAPETTAGAKDTGDDGGEVVEGEEDTVIY